MSLKFYVLFVSLLLIAVSFAGCVEDTPAASTEITTSPTLAKTTVKSITTTVKASTPTKVDLIIGQSASNPARQVTVYSAQKTPSYDWTGTGSSYTFTNKAKSGSVFVIVDAEIKNIGSDSIYATTGDFSMDDSEGNRYDPAMYLGDDRMDMLKELFQNQKVRGKIAFEVPENASKLKIYYNFGNLFSGTRLASWTVN